MNKPLGGKLIIRILGKKEVEVIKKLNLPKIKLAKERVFELKSIAFGVYSPLEGFMTKTDFNSVLKRMTLKSGVFWPIPIILDISKSEAESLNKQEKIFLMDQNGKKKLAIMKVEEIFPFNKNAFCRYVFGTNDTKHPGVKKAMGMKSHLLGGRVGLIDLNRSPFPKYNLRPTEVRKIFNKKGWRRIVGFHTRNVPHRGHEHIQREALKKTDGIFLNPLVGNKKDGDFTNELVLKTYVYLAKYVLPKGKAVLGVLPYSPYYAGPKEALLTAIIRKNFGCSHFIVGRDHTGVGNFYRLEDYKRMFEKFEKKIGIKIFHFGKAFYCKVCGSMTLEDVCPHSETQRIHPSGTKIRKAFLKKTAPREEMMRKEITELVLKENKLFV